MNTIKKLLLCVLFGWSLSTPILTGTGKQRTLVNKIINEYGQAKSRCPEKWCSFQALPAIMPTLHQIVTDIGTKLSISTPRIQILKGNMFTYLLEKFGIYNPKNSIFALSLTSNIGCIFIGEQILTGHQKSTGDRLYDDEFEALIAHELSHIYHNHCIKKFGLGLACSALATFLGYAKTIVPQTASQFFDVLATEMNSQPTQKTAFSSWHGIASFASSVIGLNAYSRHCEQQADTTATKIIKNPSSLARSLEKVRAIKQNQSNWSTWMASWFSTHPTLATRKKNLEQIKIAHHNKKSERITREEKQREENIQRIKNILK